MVERGERSGKMLFYLFIYYYYYFNYFFVLIIIFMFICLWAMADPSTLPQTRYDRRFGGNAMMRLFGNNNEQLPERRDTVSGFFKSFRKTVHGSRVVRRGRRLGRTTRIKFSCLFLTLTTSFLLYLAVFGLKVNFHGKLSFP